MDETRAIQYYLLNCGLSEGMYARIKGVQPYTEKRFIEMMCKNSPELKPDLVKKVMKSMMETGIETLQAGVPLVISDFMRITPSIKGQFTDLNDGYDNSRHSLNFNTQLDKGYVEKITSGLRIEKIGRPKINADVNRIENVRTGANELTRFFTNKIIGDYMIFSGHTFMGIELMNARNSNEKVVIERENLDIPSYTNKELSFSIVYNYELPDWLVDGMPLYLRILYHENEKDDREGLEKKVFGSFAFDTKWKVL